MIKIEMSTEDLMVTVIVVKMGNDVNISILGGDKPHIGAIALAVPREHFSENEKTSVSVSLLTVTGQKEDEIVMPVAKKISRSFNSSVVVSCGIHKDNITLKEIRTFVDLVNKATEEFIDKFKGLWDKLIS